MKKWIYAVGVVGALCSAVTAQMVVLEGLGGELTTGDFLDGVNNAGLTVDVVEIPGLKITARSGAVNQDINVTTSSMGITIFNTGDDTDALEDGEKLILSFNKNIQINRLDFNQFGTNESITISIDGALTEIHDLELTHRGSDFLDIDWVVLANAAIEFYTTGSSTIGLDGLDITVLEPVRPLELSLLHSNGVVQVLAVFNEMPATNYVLQYKGELTDTNGWNTVSTPFETNTNWQFTSTNSAGFYRAIVQ